MDFLVSKNGNPWILVEAKLGEESKLSPSLVHFHTQLNPKYALQVVLNGAYVNQNCFIGKKPLIVSAKTFLSQLP